MKWIRWRWKRKTTSWHILEGVYEGDEYTRCGRTVPRGDVDHAATLDLSDKSCETCLRLDAVGLT